MDGISAAARRCIDHPVDAQVALGGRVTPYIYSVVCEADVARRTIAVGIDRDRADAHVAARANNPDRDFAAVGDKDFQYV